MKTNFSMNYDGLTLDVAIQAINYMKMFNLKKKGLNQSSEELFKLEKELDMYSREELVILNQSKDDALWYSVMHKIDKLYCPSIKRKFKDKL